MYALITLLALAASIPTTQPFGTITLEPGVYQPGYITTSCTIRSRVPGAAVIDGAPGRHGIEVRAFSVTLDGIKVVGAGIDGIKSYAAFTTINNCEVTHAGGNGIAAHNVYALSVSNCRIVRSGTDPRYDHGIYADGMYGRITGCTITGSAAFGIHLYPSAMSWTVEGNTVDGGGIGCSGILLQGSGAITGNTILNSTWGVDLRGAGPFRVAGNVTLLPTRTDYYRGTVTTQEAQ